MTFKGFRDARMVWELEKERKKLEKTGRAEECEEIQFL